MAATAPGAPLGASYTLVSLVGKGASGQVWSVQHARQKAPLVAKILHSHLAEDAAVVERWLAGTAAALGRSGADRYAVGALHGAEVLRLRTGTDGGTDVVGVLLSQLREDLA